MKEAIGGTLTIYLILIFMLILSGYMAFSVNYTKAFRVKNEVINLIEQYEGHTPNAQSKIKDYLRNMNYSTAGNPVIAFENSVRKDNKYQYTNCQDGYCVRCWDTNNKLNADNADGIENGIYYTVYTYVNIDIPIFNKFFPGLKLFRVSGETKTIYGNKKCEDSSSSPFGKIIDSLTENALRY